MNKDNERLIISITTKKKKRQKPFQTKRTSKQHLARLTKQEKWSNEPIEPTDGLSLKGREKRQDHHKLRQQEEIKLKRRTKG